LGKAENGGVTMQGFFGKLIRVDLNKMIYWVEAVPEKIYENFLGGRGLGIYLLSQEVDQNTDPLGHHNCVIFTTGIVTDLELPGSNMYGVFTKSSITGGFGESYSMGNVALSMKRTGFDAIIIQGKSKQPVYLIVSPNGVEFKQADHLWGKDTYSSEDAILAEVNESNAQCIVIGPAGEKQVDLACLIHNYWRTAGEQGMSAVLGAKKVKGIVFHGDKKIEISWPHKLNQIIEEINNKLEKTRIFTKQREFFDSYNLNNVEISQENCGNCLLDCRVKTSNINGMYAGITIEGPKLKAIDVLGKQCGLKNMDDIVFLNDLCTYHGLDVVLVGHLCAMAIEAANQGKLPFDIRSSDANGLAKYITYLAEHAKFEEKGFISGLDFNQAIADQKNQKNYYKDQEHIGVFDTMIQCNLLSNTINWHLLEAIHKFISGIDFSAQDIKKIARNVEDAVQLFNLKNSISRNSEG
jgi:aldehyde:ferredoxin oxidoreductase